MGFGGGGSVRHGEHIPFRLCRVPDAADTEALADQMSTILRNALAGSPRPQDVAGFLGWRYREGAIGSATSTVESLLVPLNRGGFSVVVNTHRSPSPERATWLTAHEIGHSFFYVPGSPPRRIVPVTAEEEIFCDAFATRLLRPARRSVDTNIRAA
jgi:hypothetical protein